MKNDSNVKRGASLYSFQEEYFLRKMSLEDILATCSKMDIRGIEIIPDQMIPKYPNVPDAFFEQWHGWMKQYELTPTCMDMFLDFNKYKGRDMNFDEKVDSVSTDVKVANKLGCKSIRVITGTEPEVLEKVAPLAEELDVKLGIEIHSPFHMDHPYEQSLVAMYERVKSTHLGFIPDMGIFVKKFPRVISERWVRNGMKEEIAKYVVDLYDSASDLGSMDAEILKMGGSEQDIGMARTAKHFINTDPQRIVDYMPYMFHIHAKFYEMLPDYTAYSIPYEEVIPVLIKGGYKGYLSSEYEGNRHIQDAFEVDSVEQVRRQQEMFKKIIAEN